MIVRNFIIIYKLLFYSLEIGVNYLLHNTEHLSTICKLSLLVQALMFQRNIVFVQSKRFLILFTLQKEGTMNNLHFKIYSSISGNVNCRL